MAFEKILTPTDFSRCADRALTHALDVAARFEAQLHILHVVNELDPTWYGLTGVEDRTTKLRDQIKSEARDRLRALAPDKNLYDFETTVSLQLSFDVARSIQEYVDERDIQLVVMGTHGRTGLDRLMLGSVANKVIRHSPVPVMTVRADAEETVDQDVAMNTILAPIDFSTHSREALRTAKQFARRHGAHLDLLFVAETRTVPTFSDTGLPGVGVVEMDSDIVNNAEAGLRQLNQNVGGPDVESDYHVKEGGVADTIVDFAEEQGVNLIVMATRGMTGIDRFVLGSTAERVVRTGSCPVLTIRTTNGAEDQ